MAIAIAFQYDTGKTLHATIRQINTSCGQGKWWNNVSAEWEDNPAADSRKVNFAPSASPDDGVYLAGVSAQMSAAEPYTGRVLVKIYDPRFTNPVAIAEKELLTGHECRWKL